jgi:hypothetical protein
MGSDGMGQLLHVVDLVFGQRTQFARMSIYIDNANMTNFPVIW